MSASTMSSRTLATWPGAVSSRNDMPPSLSFAIFALRSPGWLVRST
ncbi:hypothetical protein ACFPRL_03085 [Pseudoclavibacter helvolus]